MKAIIQTQTPDLEKSKDFYKRLGFEVLSSEAPTYVSDGKFIVEINPDRFARNGLKLFSDDWSDVTSELAMTTHIVESADGFMTCDPNGVWVQLMKKELEYPNGTHSKAITGNFAGVSIEAFDIEKTVTFWEALGYEQTQGNLEQGWATFSNGSTIDLSLMAANMCPHLFFNPGLTFFNSGNNLENIKQIEAAGISVTEEITHFNDKGIVDNIIINDPGGLGFFIFND